jgi:hypothetical protein
MIAVVSPAGKIDKSGLIDAVMDEGIELKRETVEDIVTRYNRVAAGFAARGWNVNTGLVYLRAIITGAILGKKYDPERNGIYILATQGPEIRKELKDTTVEILGEKADVIDVFQVINLQTKVADGTLTRNRNAQIEGSYIRIAGANPSVGVYLENVNNGTEYKFTEEYIVINNPSKLMVLIPSDVAEGTYRLKIVTQFTSSGKLLNAPRQTVFGQELIVI